MMDKREIKKCVSEILDSLYDRSGFNDWWNNLDGNTEEEITLELEKIIERRLSEDKNKIVYLPFVLIQRPYILLSDKNGARKIWEKDKLKIVLYYLWRITKIKWFVKKYNQR
jgi:hypothetical protein